MVSELKPIELPPLPENPLVSVLIANYNYGRYISEAIESVLNQTYQNFEIVICDDGSTDNSLAVIEEYARRDSRVKYIAQDNGGVASALNSAYSRAQGDIICFLDSDDVFCHNKIEKVVAGFRVNDQSGFCIHRAEHFDARKRFLGIYPSTPRLPKGWVAPQLLERGGVMEFPPVSALALRREVADVIFPINKKFRTNADGVLQRIAPLVTEILAISNPLVRRRVHSHNITYSSSFDSAFFSKQLDIMKSLWEEQHKFIKQKLPFASNLLKPYSETLEYAVLNYFKKRLENNSSWETAWGNLVSHPDFRRLDRVRRWVLYFSRFIPSGFILQKYVEAFLSANKIKAFYSIMRNVVAGKGGRLNANCHF